MYAGCPSKNENVRMADTTDKDLYAIAAREVAQGTVSLSDMPAIVMSLVG